MRKKNVGRLEEVLNQIEDPQIRELLHGVFNVEISYRSSERVNFPWQKIREVVDGIARTIESKNKLPVTDETAKN